MTVEGPCFGPDEGGGLFRDVADIVAGVDEAGRGPLAGPLVAAAVILPHGTALDGLADSKTLSPMRRDRLFEEIVARCKIAVAEASPADIDRDNIHAATLSAMAKAVQGLGITPDLALIDGRFVPPKLPCPARAIVKGDQTEPVISAASIVAKVSRDRLMLALDTTFPGYGFARHKGYPTPEHLAALARLGPCPHHRLSFAPVRQALEARAGTPESDPLDLRTPDTGC
ncbi:MAG: ribonuclease HII [Pseudomonadota bacterium]